jgi:hypothetical protein
LASALEYFQSGWVVDPVIESRNHIVSEVGMKKEVGGEKVEKFWNLKSEKQETWSYGKVIFLLALASMLATMSRTGATTPCL